ncbi:MAG: proton-conducting membrane transporter [Lachnospiraceae bacterium]|nr:proton-conducting membrane transporter [Lachnospiraceae bacterium]
MDQQILIVPVLLPILAGILMIIFKPKNKTYSPILIEGIVLLNSIIVWTIILTGMGRGDGATLFRLTYDLSVYFKLDGAGMVFAGLVSFLWPLATLYSFEYMEHGEHIRSFFSLYTMTYGVTLGIAMAGNLVTLYVFYEMLTLVTFPLVLHDRTREARRASRMYLYYSIGGAACAFMGLVFVLVGGTTTDFTLGGVFKNGVAGFDNNILLAMYVLAFFGFGVKAAICPVQKWLPAASVAPTPVTALLHAVAVVKSGAFAILRLTYYCYGADFLRGTWAHYLVSAFVMITIIYGSTMAVKEIHFKKRLAYSTISNVSYILLGAVMMSPLGLVAALSHLIFHAFMKICSFFAAGAVMHKANRNYVYELDGLGLKMPVTFACFAASALCLMGVPPFSGFISKWNIVQAALGEGGVLGICAVVVLLYSALMTSIYMLTVVVRAYIPPKGTDLSANEGVTDPGWKMLVPLVIFVIVFTAMGIYSRPITDSLSMIAAG